MQFTRPNSPNGGMTGRKLVQDDEHGTAFNLGKGKGIPTHRLIKHRLDQARQNMDEASSVSQSYNAKSTERRFNRSRSRSGGREESKAEDSANISGRSGSHEIRSGHSGMQNERNFVDAVIHQNDLIRSAPRKQRQQTASSDEGNIDGPSDGDLHTESFDNEDASGDRESHNISSFHQDISRSTTKKEKAAIGALSRRKT